MEYVDEDGEGFVCSLDASLDAAVLGEVSVMPSPSRPVIKNDAPVDCVARRIDQSFPDILLQHDQDCMDHYMGRRSLGHYSFVLSHHHIEEHLLPLHYLVLYLCLCVNMLYCIVYSPSVFFLVFPFVGMVRPSICVALCCRS